MSLCSMRREEIENEVARLYRTCRVILRHMRAKELAGRLGIMMIPYSWVNKKARRLSLKCSPFGYKLNRNGQDMIFYNDGLDECDIEITIFHEIGHIILDHPKESPEADEEAECFAYYAMNYNSIVVRSRLHVAINVLNKSIEEDRASSM